MRECFDNIFLLRFLGSNLSSEKDLMFKTLYVIISFRRKFLCGRRQISYLHIKVLIFVCPNRTCKTFENRSADTVLTANLNFE